MVSGGNSAVPAAAIMTSFFLSLTIRAVQRPPSENVDLMEAKLQTSAQCLIKKYDCLRGTVFHLTIDTEQK